MGKRQTGTDGKRGNASQIKNAVKGRSARARPACLHLTACPRLHGNLPRS
jgi:hypothetical protein